MTYLLAFLIGVAFLASMAVVQFVFWAQDSKRDLPDSYFALSALLALVVGVFLWVNWDGMMFVASFGGWVLGIAILTAISVRHESLVRKSDDLILGTGYDDTGWSSVDPVRVSTPTTTRSPERALAHIADASSFIEQFRLSGETNPYAIADAFLLSADQAMSAIEADWLCGDGYILLAVAYDTVGSIAIHTSEIIAKECADLSVSVIIRWAKLKERNALLETSEAGISIALQKWGKLLSESNLKLFRVHEYSEREMFAIDRQRVLELREQLAYLAPSGPPI